MSDVRVEVDMDKLEEFIKTIKPGKVVRILHDGVDYGIYQEFGTRRMASHPFMVPAIERVRPTFFKGIRQLRNLQDAENFVHAIATHAEGHAKELAPYEFGNLYNSIGVKKAEEFSGWRRP